jgi:hypothetical protein
MTEQEAFTTYLRRHRQRSGLTLPGMAASTRIRLELLEGLERNEFDGWPRGIYARAYVRDYATAVGLDPEETVDEFCRLFPLGDRRAQSTMTEMAAIVAADPTWRDEFEHPIDRRKPSAHVNLLAQPKGMERVRAAMTAGGRTFRATAAALTRSVGGEGFARLRRRGHAEPSR